MAKTRNTDSEPAVDPAPLEQVSYPPAARAIRDEQGNIVEQADPAEKERARKWKEMGLVKCCHPRCHYPLQVVLDDRRNPRTIKTPEGPANVAVCTWHPDHLREDGSEQFVLLETLRKDEE